MPLLAFPFQKYRHIWLVATATLCLATYFISTIPFEGSFITNPRCVLDSNSSIKNSSETPSSNTHPTIKDKVAVISDTQYTNNLIPLILHYHAILGPSWPIIFYTSPQTIHTHFLPDTSSSSAVWTQAIREARIEIRTIPEEFNLTSRNGVNQYLSQPWLWEQLAPATHVLIFQADSILCGNGLKTIDDFISEQWDWIGAPLSGSEHLYNGGLSLRNRTKILEILSDPRNNWEEETEKGEWTMGGEDVWFSRKMDLMGAKLPSFREALGFACQHEWHVSEEKRPAGYHKVHKNIGVQGLREIEEWCPEIALARPGILEPST